VFINQGETMSKKYFSVWVGGIEVNSNELDTRKEAEKLAFFWREIQGYDDVAIEEVETAE
jgi:hypothetical protein